MVVFDSIYQNLLVKGIVTKVLEHNASIEKTHRELQLDDANFTMRFQNSVNRVLSDQLALFSNMVAAFISAERSDLMVGVNIVAPEGQPRVHAQLLAAHADVQMVQKTISQGEVFHARRRIDARFGQTRRLELAHQRSGA